MTTTTTMMRMMIQSVRLTNVALQNVRNIRRSSDMVKTMMMMTMTTRLCHHRCIRTTTNVQEIGRRRLFHTITTSKDGMADNDTTTTTTLTTDDDVDEDDQLLLQDLIRRYDEMKPHPVSVQDMLTAPSTMTLKETNDFLREEFSIRCAERICMMQERIPNFRNIPELQRVHQIHIQNFRAMRNFDKNNNNDDKDFVPVVRSIVERGRDMIPLMCQGMSRLIDNDDTIDEAFTNTFLNEFLLNRIGSNVLMSQYLSIVSGDCPTSIIDPHCNVAAICRDTARAVQELCFHETGFRPTIHVVETPHLDDDETNNTDFAFIPPVLSYILQELLKNSSVATARKQQERQQQKQNNKTVKPYPQQYQQSRDDDSISVVVCSDERRVMIHIGDRAGGIPFDVGQHIWSYMYTTKKKKKIPKNHDPTTLDDDDSSKHGRDSSVPTALGGFGVGLPLSRLYASYLGGSINLVSLPGYGTHAYIFLPKLPEALVENVPGRADGWNVTSTKFNGEFIL